MSRAAALRGESIPADADRGALRPELALVVRGIASTHIESVVQSVSGGVSGRAPVHFSGKKFEYRDNLIYCEDKGGKKLGSFNLTIS